MNAVVVLAPGRGLVARARISSCISSALPSWRRALWNPGNGTRALPVTCSRYVCVTHYREGHIVFSIVKPRGRDEGRERGIAHQSPLPLVRFRLRKESDFTGNAAPYKRCRPYRRRAAATFLFSSFSASTRYLALEAPIARAICTPSSTTEGTPRSCEILQTAAGIPALMSTTNSEIIQSPLFVRAMKFCNFHRVAVVCVCVDKQRRRARLRRAIGGSREVSLFMYWRVILNERSPAGEIAVDFIRS